MTAKERLLDVGAVCSGEIDTSPRSATPQQFWRFHGSHSIQRLNKSNQHNKSMLPLLKFQNQIEETLTEKCSILTSCSTADENRLPISDPSPKNRPPPGTIFSHLIKLLITSHYCPRTLAKSFWPDLMGLQ